MIQLLKLLSSAYPSFTPTKDTIDSWRVLLSKESPKEALAAVIYLGRNSIADFAPTPAKVIAQIRQLRQQSIPNAELAWQKPQMSELSRKAWQLWGGDARWGSLPDPKYSDNPIAAQNVVSFAQKEFIGIYNGILEQENKGQDHLDHSNAKNLLEHAQTKAHLKLAS